MKKTYSFAKGARFSVDPGIVGEVLEEIEARDGLVSPHAFLQMARRKRSPLHNMFDWDDTEAAEKWRLHQARGIINKVQVEVSQPDGGTRDIRAFVHVTGGYKDTLVVAADTDELSDALSEIEAKIAGLKRLVSDLEEMAGDQEELPIKIKAIHTAFRTIDGIVASIH